MSEHTSTSNSSITYEASNAGRFRLRISRKLRRIRCEDDVTASQLKEHLICKLCQQIFKSPVTITRCLHSFCNGCLSEHIKKYRSCPTCSKLIHPLRPSVNIRKDAALHRLVCKLFPQNMIQEINKLNEISEKRKNDESSKKINRIPIFIGNEQISLCLNPSKDCLFENKDNLQRYMLCPAKMPIRLLQKFILSKFDLNEENHWVDFKYELQNVNLSYKLLDVAYIFGWQQNEPMSLTYQICSTSSKNNKIIAQPIINKLNAKLSNANKIEPLKEDTQIKVCTSTQESNLEGMQMSPAVGNNNNNGSEDSSVINVINTMSSSTSPLNNNSESESNHLELRKKTSRKQKSLESVIMSLRPKQMQNSLVTKTTTLPQKTADTKDIVMRTIDDSRDVSITDSAEEVKVMTCAGETIVTTVHSSHTLKSPSKACQTCSELNHPGPIKGIKRMFEGFDVSEMKKHRFETNGKHDACVHPKYSNEQLLRLHQPRAKSVGYNRPHIYRTAAQPQRMSAFLNQHYISEKDYSLYGQSQLNMHPLERFNRPPMINGYYKSSSPHSGILHGPRFSLIECPPEQSMHEARQQQILEQFQLNQRRL